MTPNEEAFYAVIIALVWFLVGVFVATMLGADRLRDAGIEKIVRCNNSQSNWVEIVWRNK